MTAGIFIPFDEDIMVIARQRNRTYTRFADDLTLRSDEQLQQLRMAYEQAQQSIDPREPVSWINAAYLRAF